MNMYSSSDSNYWQPLSLQDFTLSNSPSIAIIEEDSTVEMIEASSLMNETEEAMPEITFDLERLKTEATEQGYHEGHTLGQQDGFNAGKQLGHDQGYQEGLKQGIAQAEQQFNEEKMKLSQSMASLLANFQQALNDLDDVIIPQLTDVALVAAQKMVSDLPKSLHMQLKKSIQTLIQQFPLLPDSIQLHVNPDDIGYIETIFSDELNKYHWQLVADPTIDAGGCKLLSDKNEIDVTLNSKWQTLRDVVNGERS